MSASPPKETEVEQGAQSGDDAEHMEREQEGAQGQGLGDFEVKEQDRWLPIANALSNMSGESPPPVLTAQHGTRLSSSSHGAASDANIRNFAPVARIMKTALPENAKIAKEAKECMQECVSEFISFITSEASEKCQQEKRKTVNGEDILFAMTSLGFENYSEALKIYLSKFRETQSTRGDQARPASSGGYNSGGPVGGAAGGSSSTNASGGPAAATAAYPGQSENSNNILSPNMDPAEHDSNAYGYAGMVGAGHNGTGPGDY
ncbi:MAG: hypothetical protein Q9227_005190 [Pyrenula ochraceoflavens]